MDSTRKEIRKARLYEESGFLAPCTKDRRTVGVHRRGPGPDPARMKGLQPLAIRQNAQNSRPGKPGRLTGNPVIEKGSSTTTWSPSSLREEERSPEGEVAVPQVKLTITHTHQIPSVRLGRDGLAQAPHP